jgi:hypothetical protein
VQRRTLLVLAGLALVALAAKAPLLLHAPPYGDEGLFLYGAQHPFQVPQHVAHPDGSPIYFPRSLVLERPLFYAASWLPAQLGFPAFRLWNAAIGALLAPLAYVLVRESGGRRATGVLAGLAVGLAPQLVVWGTYGQTDALMTLLLGLSLLARARGGHLAAGLLMLGAVWTKETAFAAAGLVLLLELRHGRDRRRLACHALPVLLGLAPLLLAIATGFPIPGTHESSFHLQLVDEAFLSPWLLPVLLVGVALPASRRGAATGLLGGGLLLAMHAVLYSVQAWYLVPSVFLALVGVAVAADAAWRAPSWPRLARVAPAAVAGLVILAAILLPAGPARAALRPLHGDGGDALAGTYAYETGIRDRDLVAALAALQLDGRHDLVAVGVYHAHLYPLEPKVRWLWMDSADAGPVAARLAATSARMAANGTWAIVALDADSVATAFQERFAACAAWHEGRYAVYDGSRCTPG